MNQDFKLTKTLKTISMGLIAIGIVSFVIGFIFNPEKTWGNYLLNNYYFLALAIGGTFWLALQRVTRSGWSVAYFRIPEAFGSYIPVAGIFILFMFLGFYHLYEWTHPEVLEYDPILQHKAPYLNVPFFMIRLVFYFIVWIWLVSLLRKYSFREDEIGGMANYEKAEWYAKIYIFALLITFSMASFDWIMSIDSHWYSTIFSLKNFVAGFYHGSAMIILIIIIMNKYGHFKFINNSHMIDLSKYIFILAIIWGYFWFSQYLLMWYANIPEETIYYVDRIEGPWAPLFWLNIILNTGIPFVLLLANYLAKKKIILGLTTLIVLIAFWIDLYLQIMPGAVGEEQSAIGFLEVGTFLGYIGLFLFVVFRSLSKHPLVPESHPLLEESVKHHLHEV